VATDWKDTAEAYATSFAALCAGTTGAILQAIGAGRSSLLDVGTGTGVVARAAVEHGLTVTACDSDPGMVRYATAALSGIDIATAALPHLPYGDDAFDVVVANFVVNHLPDPRAGLRELRRVCSAGGLCFTTIWPATPAGMNGFWAEILEEAGIEPPVGSRLPPERDFERSETGLGAMMREAGLGDVTATRLRWRFEIEPQALWRGVAGGIATIGATYRQADADGRAALHAAFLQRVAELAPTGALSLPVEAVLAVGSA
jgi:SAM-dependent methyltransferase